MNSDLELVLNEVKKFVIPTKEATIFALGGRSYYENPASDLLAFFLKPDAEHGLKDLFLSTFLESIGEGHRQFDMGFVDIQRETPTANQNRIDLQISGRNWCLLIENKIYHWQANPFKDYEAHAEQQFREKAKLFSILSPDGSVSLQGSANPDRWKGVSYKEYCQKLREKMASKFFDMPFSKWQLFAREFILHMENELYNPPMTSDQVAFFEKYADQIAEVQKLANQYREFIVAELKQRLEASIPGQIFSTKDEGWAFRCSTPRWGSSDVVLIKPEIAGTKNFKIRAYLKDISDSNLLATTQALQLGEPAIERPYHFWTSVGYDSREEAVVELCKLVQVVNGLIKN